MKNLNLKDKNITEKISYSNYLRLLFYRPAVNMHEDCTLFTNVLS